MTYTIGAGKSFNMVLSHPDDSDPSTWDQQNTLSEMRCEFQGWDSRYESMNILGIILLLIYFQTREDYWTHRKDHQMATDQWSPFISLGEWQGVDTRRRSTCNATLHVTG